LPEKPTRWEVCVPQLEAKGFKSRVNGMERVLPCLGCKASMRLEILKL